MQNTFLWLICRGAISKLSEKDRHKTAFTANGQLYQWKVMCMGVCNAPSTFTRIMDLVLNGLTFVYCLVYLDDTIVYSKSFDEHLAHFDEIFSRLSVFLK